MGRCMFMLVLNVNGLMHVYAIIYVPSLANKKALIKIQSLKTCSIITNTDRKKKKKKKTCKNHDKYWQMKFEMKNQTLKKSL